MNLRKRVIESTIIAVMLTVVTAVTAVMQTAPVENVPEPQQETKAVADVQANGSAGIIEELASLGDAATEQASISTPPSLSTSTSRTKSLPSFSYRTFQSENPASPSGFSTRLRTVSAIFFFISIVTCNNHKNRSGRQPTP